MRCCLLNDRLRNVLLNNSSLLLAFLFLPLFLILLWGRTFYLFPTIIEDLGLLYLSNLRGCFLLSFLSFLCFLCFLRLLLLLLDCLRVFFLLLLLVFRILWFLLFLLFGLLFTCLISNFLLARLFNLFLFSLNRCLLLGAGRSFPFRWSCLFRGLSGLSFV